MRNRKFYGAFVVAAMMSVAMLATTKPVSAEWGDDHGKPGRSVCAWLQGMLDRVGNPERFADVMEAVSGCELD